MSEDGGEALDGSVGMNRTTVDEAEGEDRRNNSGSSALKSMGYNMDGSSGIDRSRGEGDDSEGFSLSLGTVLRVGPIVVILAFFLIVFVLSVV